MSAPTEATAGRIDTAPKIQMMKDLLVSMGVEEADPKARQFRDLVPQPASLAPDIGRTERAC